MSVKSYRYETHLHTSPVSRCAHATVRQTLEAYAKFGYDGVFITNHFLDGPLNFDKTKPYEEQINFYFSAYDEAKKREYQEWLASQPPTQNNSSSNTVNGMTWLLPINYTYFSSPFGWRDHPVYGGQRFHYGVDLAAPQGTPIYATRGGRVTVATYDSSSGYYVSINHLDGFVTKYLHMTHYIVSPGQYVAAGQVIGYCGSTGASTGPHLHFGIYKDGVAVNPALYINIR